jgi:hypothetical protein
VFPSPFQATYSLQNKQGTIYLTYPESPAISVPSSRPIELSDPLILALRRGDDVEDTDDILVNINLATFSVESLWLASSNTVYLEIGAPLLSVMSATLLRPVLQRQIGRLHPGFCPYVPILSINQAGQIQDLIAKELVAGGSPVGNVGHRMDRNAWLQYSLISASPLLYEARDFEMKFVTAAVVGLALLIAGFGGLILTAAVLKAINVAVIEQAKAALIQKRVDKREKVVDEPEKGAVEPAEPSTSSADIPPLSLWASIAAWRNQKKRHDNSSPAIVSDLQSVFDVVASVGEALYKALFVNSLKAFRSSFNNTRGKKLKYTYTYGKLFENFHSDLEQFCCRERLSMPEVNLSEDGRKLLRKYGFNLTIQTTQAVFTNLKKVPSKNQSSFGSKKQQKTSLVKLKRQQVLSAFFTEQFEVSDFDYDEVPVETVRRQFEKLHDGIILRNSDVMAQGCKVIDRDIWNVSLRKMKATPWLVRRLSRVRESFAAISSNITLNIILPLPLVLLAFVQQEEERTFALPGDEVFTLQAALVGPARDRPRATAFEEGYLSWQLTAMLSFFVGYLVVFIVDYSLYLLLPQLEPARQGKEGK